SGNIPDVLDRRACRSCYDPDFTGIHWNRAFIFLGKHSHFFQFLFQCQKTFIQKACALQGDFSCVKLIFSIPLINTYAASRYHPVSVFHGKSQSLSLSGKHHTGNRSGFILQRKINMTGSMILTVRYFAFYIDPFQHKVLVKHIFYIGIYLSYRINAVHKASLATFPKIPLIKEAESSPPNTLLISTASLMATFTGTSSSYFISNTARRRMFKSTLLILFVFQPVDFSFRILSISSRCSWILSYLFSI